MPDTLTRWVPDRRVPRPDWPEPPLATAMWRGAAGRCPACGETPLFSGWLRVRPACPHCAAPLGALRADDAPPYVVAFIVGHFAIGGLVALERYTAISVAAEAGLLLPLSGALALGLLRPVKGALLGMMLRLGMVPERDG